MIRRATVVCLVFSLVGLVMAIYLAGCGSGGGGGGFAGSTDQQGTGTVSVLLADGPADEFDHIYVTVTEVSLIPVRGNSVVLFRSREGCEVDLLELREEDFLLTVNRRVPARLYEKIRLRVSGIRAEGGPCEELEIKLPSGKIDLNPREAFKVVSGGTLWIRLDIDANKSIHLHPAGQSGKCIFRPVVFVEIQPGEPIRRCPQILSGTIARLVDEDEDGEIDGFILDLRGSRGELEVLLSEDTAIWNELGEPSGPDILAPHQEVKVRGRLDENGRLEASVVVLGQVLVVKGEVDGPVDDVTGLFPFTPFPGEELVGQHDVEVADETLILIGCDTRVEKETIQAGMTATVVGKLVKVGGEDVLRSVVVLLRAREVSGQIVLIEDEYGGKRVIVEQETGGEVEVFVPSGTPINIEGDGSVPMELFCVERQVRIFLDPDIPDPLTATLVLVGAERRVGEVLAVDESDRTLTVADGDVNVQPGATILDTRGTVDTLVEFEEISPGDHLEYFGLEGCTSDTGFTAFVIVITG